MKFWNTLQVNRKAVLIMLAFQAGFFAFGVGLVLFINRFLNDEPSYGCVGSMMAAIGVFAGVAAGGTGSTRFRLAVMMGQSRRSFLLWDTLATACRAAVGWLAAWGLYHLEIALYTALYPGFVNEMSLMPFFIWPALGAVVLGVCVLDLAIGAIQVRFGNKVFLALWLILCFSPMVVGRAVDMAQSGQATLLARLGESILAVAGALTPGQWALAGAAALASVTGMSIGGLGGAVDRG